MTLILSGTDGLSDIDGSAATPAIRGTDTNTGIFFGADIIGFAEGGAEVARFNADAQFVAAAGTASLPVITTTGDTNTGIFFPAADTIAFAEGGAEVMRIDSSGNVGIGTSSPTALRTRNLEVSSSGTNDSAAVIVNKRGTGIATMRLATVGAATGFDINFNFPNTGDLGFSDLASAATRMIIDSSGNLLVGTTSSDITAVGIRLMNNNQLQTSKSGDWSLRTGRRDSTGIIQEIYYNSSRVGDIATNGSNTTYNSASDYRLKENVEPMTGALTKVASLKPVTYKWKVDGSDGQGFIAHELAEVVPDAVRGTKDEIDSDGKPVYQSIDTSVLVATLTAAIQELKALTDTQASTITALTARIEALENK